MNVCKNCGFEFEFDGNFCPRCGTRFNGSDSSDVTLSSYGGDDKGAEGMTSSAFDGGCETKEKNILEHVGRLIEFGGFIEAEEMLKDLEKDEVSRLGYATAALYCYKILTRYRVSSDEELVRKLVGLGLNLKSDIDYRMAQACPDSVYKERIDEIEKSVEERFSAKGNAAGDGSPDVVSEAVRRNTAILSGLNVGFALVGMIFLFVGVAAYSRFLEITSFIVCLVLCVVSIAFSAGLIRKRAAACPKMTTLNEVVIVLAITFAVMGFIFLIVW